MLRFSISLLPAWLCVLLAVGAGWNADLGAQTPADSTGPVWQEMEEDDRERLLVLRGEVRDLTRVPLGQDSVIWTLRLTVEVTKSGTRQVEQLFWNPDHKLLGWKSDTASTAPLVYYDLSSNYGASIYLADGLGQRIPPHFIEVYGFFDGKGEDYWPPVDKQHWGEGERLGAEEQLGVERTGYRRTDGAGKTSEAQAFRMKQSPNLALAMALWQGLQPSPEWRALTWPKGEALVQWAQTVEGQRSGFEAVEFAQGRWGFDAGQTRIEDPERTLLDVARERAKAAPTGGH